MIQQLGDLLSIHSTTLTYITLVVSVLIVPVVAIVCFIGTWKLLDKGVEKPPMKGGCRGLAMAFLLTLAIGAVGLVIASVMLILFNTVVAMVAAVAALFG